VEHSTARRSPRSHGGYRQTMYTSEVSAIFYGITSGAHSFENATEVQLLGMCTMLHHILFQTVARPHVGPRTHHGLGTLLSEDVVSPADIADRQVLMVGLIQPTRIESTQVRSGYGEVYAPYGINRPNFVERFGNCEMEEEHGHRHSSISFGFWNSPDFILHSNSGVSVVVVYPAWGMLAGTELVWEYAGVVYPDSARNEEVDARSVRPAGTRY
jgi:hypothetical protein